ncbi:MAG TPA: serine/threonine-protein kinase [Planctomycetota bacterium]|nr:serine/threonine-protein kinase [Planctomycetota bacterium]
MSDNRDLELLLLAVQQGLLTRTQLDECLHEWDERHDGAVETVGVPAFRELAVRKGFLTEEGLRRLASDPGRTPITNDIVVVCRDCKAERTLSLDAALRRPRCGSCSGRLHFGKPAPPTTGPLAVPKRSVSEEVRNALQDPKSRFGKYVLLSKLGTGGMGEVWRAWDMSVYRMVALKFPRTTGEEEVRRLHLEAQGAGGLSHPNIASIYEVAEAEGRHYIAMQYIAGKTAEDAIKGARPDSREIVRWIRDAARGVHYAHERGVIHRDLKPANLMIDTEGRVYVMDFGLAKLTSGEGSATVSGVILGTPAFMPPEQAAANSGQVDHRSDVYALGSTLYVLLSGQRPFDGESATDILVQILTRDPQTLKQVWSQAPWELEAIVARSMSRARDQRYQTAGEMADDLDRFLKGAPVQARRQGIALRLWRMLKNRAATVLTIGACVLLLAGAAAFYARSSRPVPPGPSGPDRLKLWADFFPGIQRAVSADSFDAAAAAPLLERLDREFPEQKSSVNTLLEGEHRDIVRAIDELPRARWIESAPRIRRYRDWLAFMKKPVDGADRILAYKGTMTLIVQVAPYAEVRGPLVEQIPAEERVTPLCLRNLEIRDGGLQLAHPELGTRAVALPVLKNGGTVTIEGSLKDPPGIRILEGP